MSQNKYKAQGIYWLHSEQRILSENEAKWVAKKHKGKSDNFTFFGSMFELKVYRMLTCIFGSEAIKYHVPVALLPPSRCLPKGKSWKVDFAILPDALLNRPQLYLEAKGYPTSVFLNNLAILEATNPSVFNHLSIVFDYAIPKNLQVIKNLKRTNDKEQNKFSKVLLFDEFINTYSQLQKK